MRSQVTRLSKPLSPISQSFKQTYRASLDNPIAFWEQQAKEITWSRFPKQILDSSNAPIYRWFPDGELNTCYNALDVHVERGLGNKKALIYDSPLAGVKKEYTYSQLLEKVSHFANVLIGHGVKKGDRVLIYMPMIPEGAIAMLACSRIGAIHSVVFGGFAPKELSTRINDAKPVCIVTASCGLLGGNRTLPYKPIVDEAIELSAHKPRFTLLYQRENSAKSNLKEGRDFDWDDCLRQVPKTSPCTILNSSDPLYVLYTSGTTGNPKGIQRDNGGHAVAIKWSISNFYGCDENSVIWAASDIGWVVGHSYIVYGPLMSGITSVLYEGKPVGTPDAGAFWRMIEEHKVNVMFTAPTALRAIRKEDPESLLMAKYNISSLRGMFLAGEHSDPETVKWAQKLLQKKNNINYDCIYDHYWQTETGWPMTGPCVKLLGGFENVHIKPGSAHHAVPGYEIVAKADKTQQNDGDNIAPLYAKLPLPPGTFSTLYNSPERYIQSYITEDGKWFKTGDAGYIDEDGYVYIMSRTDDVINVAGHRFATSAFEEVVNAHPSVAECAVFGVPDKMKGQVPICCVVVKNGWEDQHSKIPNQIVESIRKSVGAVACLERVYIVERLPKTRSGKILRKELSKIASGASYSIPPTIEDPAVLSEIEVVLIPKK